MYLNYLLTDLSFDKTHKEINGKPHKFLSYGKTVDFALRFEELNNTAIEKLCKYLKIENKKLNHLNKSNRKNHYSYYYDTELIEVILSHEDPLIRNIKLVLLLL